MADADVGMFCPVTGGKRRLLVHLAALVVFLNPSGSCTDP